MRLDDRGVSEVLAFVVVFSIIITSVGLVYSIGFGSLNDFQEGEQKTNSVRAFDAFSTVFDDIQQGRAVTRSGELKLSGGTIQVTDDSEFDVRVNDDTDTIWDWNGGSAETTGSLRYDVDGTVVAYENGAVFRKDGDSSAMIGDPSFRCGDDRAVISIVVLDGNSSTAQSRDGNVEITADVQDERMLFSTTGSDSSAESVTITVDDSEFGDAWERNLESNGWTDDGGGEYSCSADRIVVRVTVISVEIPPPS